MHADERLRRALTAAVRRVCSEQLCKRLNSFEEMQLLRTGSSFVCRRWCVTVSANESTDLIRIPRFAPREFVWPSRNESRKGPPVGNRADHQPILSLGCHGRRSSRQTITLATSSPPDR